MDLQDYLRVVRKRWSVIVLVALLAIAAAATVTLLTPKKYAASIEFFVSTSGAQDTSALLQGSTFTQERVKSYSQLVQTPKVLGPVIQRAGLDTTPDQFTVTTTVPLDTVLIDVTVTDSTPQAAAKIAEAIGAQFPAAVAELESVGSGSSSPVKLTVVRDAVVDPAPVAPKPIRNIALGAVLGLFLGFGLALLRDMLDTTVKYERDLEDVTDETVIGAIAYDSDAPAHPLIVQVDPKSQRAEAFRSLRTNLQFVDAGNHPRSIVVSSSVPGEGKSTTAANLGLTLAAAGSRVCLVEGDLRRPRLLDYLGLEGAVGMTDVLIGRTELRETLQQFGDTSMWVLGSGAIPPNPSELLGSAAMRRMIKDLETRFDYLLIDSPPLLPVTDAAILTGTVGGALLVVGAGVVTKDQVRRALASLEAVNGRVLGVVVNRLPKKDGSAYGNYRYTYSSDGPEERVTKQSVSKRRTRERTSV